MIDKNMQTVDYLVDILAKHDEIFNKHDNNKELNQLHVFIDYVINNYEIVKRLPNDTLPINRKKEIRKEAKRRLNLWLKHSTFNEMTCYGSYIRFQMALGMAGYPFVKEPWMKGDFERFVFDYEFNSKDFDLIIEDLFKYAR
jgi:hypothetical protein